jgi:hypothetical protein
MARKVFDWQLLMRWTAPTTGRAVYSNGVPIDGAVESLVGYF